MLCQPNGDQQGAGWGEQTPSRRRWISLLDEEDNEDEEAAVLDDEER